MRGLYSRRRVVLHVGGERGASCRAGHRRPRREGLAPRTPHLGRWPSAACRSKARVGLHDGRRRRAARSADGLRCGPGRTSGTSRGRRSAPCCAARASSRRTSPSGTRARCVVPLDVGRRCSSSRWASTSCTTRTTRPRRRPCCRCATRRRPRRAPQGAGSRRRARALPGRVAVDERDAAAAARWQRACHSAVFAAPRRLLSEHRPRCSVAARRRVHRAARPATAAASRASRARARARRREPERAPRPSPRTCRRGRAAALAARRRAAATAGSAVCATAFLPPRHRALGIERVARYLAMSGTSARVRARARRRAARSRRRRCGCSMTTTRSSSLSDHGLANGAHGLLGKQSL